MDAALPIAGGSVPTTILGFQLTPALMARLVGSTVLTTLGIFYLNKGKKDADLSSMISGLVFILLGLAVFA